MLRQRSECRTPAFDRITQTKRKCCSKAKLGDIGAKRYARSLDDVCASGCGGRSC